MFVLNKNYNNNSQQITEHKLEENGEMRSRRIMRMTTRNVSSYFRYFNWTYVAVVYSDSEYGVHCYEALRDFAANDSICFTTPQRVIRYQYQDSDYDQIIRTVVNKQNIRGKLKLNAVTYTELNSCICVFCLLSLWFC